MDIEELRNYCFQKKAVTECFPFDETTLVLKVGSKIFCLAGLDNIPFRFNLKCDPERAIELRERYEEVTPGYHCNKKHWNTITPNGEIPKSEILELIDHSYDLVYNSLKKIERTMISES